MHYTRTASIVNIFAAFRLATLSRLVTHFCFGHNVRRSARGDCTTVCKLLSFYKYIYIYI